MDAVLWRDYLCPWCHLGRDRTALLASLGVSVDARSLVEKAVEDTSVRIGRQVAGAVGVMQSGVLPDAIEERHQLRPLTGIQWMRMRVERQR